MALQIRPFEVIPGPQLQAMRASLQKVRTQGPEKFQLTLKTLAMWERLCIAVETLQARLASVAKTNAQLTNEIAATETSGPFTPDFGFLQRLQAAMPAAPMQTPLPPGQKYVTRLPGKKTTKGRKKRKAVG